MAVTSGTGDDPDDDPPTPWHNRTSSLLGASAIGLIALAIVWATVSWVAGPSDDADQAPLYFVDPTSSSTSGTTTPTTTATVTSTSPPATTDINAPIGPPPAPPPPSSSERTSDAETTPSAEEDEDEDESTTRRPRRTPRTNITRTLSPRP